jgi:hypothetical protein
MAGEAIEVIGVGKVTSDLHGIAERMIDVAPALAAQIHPLEVAQEAAFAALGGRYVDTGAVRRSLTMSGTEGAVRRLSGNELMFGTAIWYARFLTERVGPQTEAGGMARPLPLAVMKLPPAMADEAGHAVARHIVGDAGERVP